MPRPAAFLDRDGTIIEDADYLRDPDGLRLLAGAAPAIARLNAASVPVIVVTNQSGIARGLLTIQDYDAVHARLTDALAGEGAYVDAAYVCPHHPEFTGPCECRKPGTLLYRQAAAERDLDLARSVYIGDRWRDVAPAIELGGHGILIIGPATPADDLRRAEGKVEITDSVSAAADRALTALGRRPAPPASRP